jgi:hypothetical protein
MSLVLNVEILGEFKKLTQATQGAQGSLEGLSKKASKVGSSIKRVVGALGLALGFNAIVNGFKNAVAAAEEAETANARIDAIAESMNEFGDQTAVVTKRIRDFASANQFSLGVDDEVIKATQAKLLTFRELTKTADTMGGSFDRATIAAIDMAAAGFGTAESNATQLGKALNDPIKGITALNRAGIQFTEDQKALIESLVQSGNVLAAQDMILKEIESQVGGTAAATANASEKMNIAFGEVSESLGTILLPLVEAFSNWLIEITPQVTKFFEELNDPATETGKSWAGLIAVVRVLGQQLDGLFRVMGGGSSAFSSINNFLTATIAGFSQLLWMVGRVADAIGALLSGNFKGAGRLVANFMADYNAFVATQNRAIETQTYVPQSMPEVTINVYDSKVTAQEIVDKLQKARQSNGSLGSFL